MLNAHKAACCTATRIAQTPRPFARDLYRLRPGGQMAVFLGCECHTLPVLVKGIDDARPRISTSCILHGRHPSEVPAYV